MHPTRNGGAASVNLVIALVVVLLAIGLLALAVSTALTRG